MTKCESWCGKKVPSHRVPFDAAWALADEGFVWAYCKTTCRDRATAKPATTIECEYCAAKPLVADAQTHLSWHLARGDKKRAATTAPERKLANGWQAGGYRWPLGNESRCDRWGCHVVAEFNKMTLYGPELGACEAHAAEMGVWDPVRVVIDETDDDDTKAVQAAMDKAIEINLGGKFTKRVYSVKVEPCGRCMHRHVGPCNGSSPNGEYACPCGHERVEAKRETKVVGDYERIGPASAYMTLRDAQSGATATLLANLERERVPGRRPIRTVRWYEGNGDE